MSYLDIAKQIDEGTGCKTAIMPDPYKVAKDYFEKQEIIKTEPALYLLDEILSLKDRTPQQLMEIHSAKLIYPCQRIIQEGPEKPPDRANQSEP